MSFGEADDKPNVVQHTTDYNLYNTHTLTQKYRI